jgi:predicted nucleic acid-binding protein
MRIALDTNVLAYATGLNDAARKNAAVELLRRFPPEDLFLPVQALGELFHVLVTKAAIKRPDAQAIVLKWYDRYSVVETSQAVLLSAMELASEHGLRIWDAIMMAAAVSAECRLLLSEDLHHGFTWNGVTVVNPFSKTPHELLTEAIDL